MTRDAFMAGVPVVTDIPRLVQKVRALQLNEEELPDELSRVRGRLKIYVMLGIAHSGGRTLDELVLGRVLLFDKIYLHHKLRAIEAMVALILLKLSALSDQGPGTSCLAHSRRLNTSLLKSATASKLPAPTLAANSGYRQEWHPSTSTSASLAMATEPSS